MQSNTSTSPDSPAAAQKQLRRAVIASTVGTTIEWYDFFLYSTVTGLVFAQLFFPKSDHATGTLEAFSVYFVGFLARPVGAAIFGHLGDRIGRRLTLIMTLLIMGIATFLVGLVPGYASIGVWGAVILTLLRFVQGVGVGGDWGGSVLLAMEWAQSNKHRGFIASWPQFGVPAGLFTANLAVLGASAISGDHFLEWGWRLPFLVSIVLVGIGLYLRLRILETPTFRRLAEQNKLSHQPMLEVLREHPGKIVLSALLRAGEQAPFYIFTAFIFSYGTSKLGMSRSTLLAAVLVASAFSLVSIPLFGHLSDRIGRRRMYLIGAILTGLYGFVYFRLLDTSNTVLVFVAVALSLVPHDMMYGPQAALIAENFKGKYRTSGASLGYQLSSVINGGPSPIIAAALFAHYQSGYAIAVYVLVCALVSIAASLLMTDQTNKSIDQD